MARLLCFAIALLVFAACESDAIIVGPFRWWPLQKFEFKNVRELIERATHRDIGPIIKGWVKVVPGGTWYKANYYKTDDVANSPICFIEFSVEFYRMLRREYVHIMKGPACHSHN